MALVIIGGGVIGLSIAYYTSLSCPDRRIIIVDSEKELLLSASGFSGGYIVRDWFCPSVLPLAELSYQLHKDLAAKNDGRNKWGYSESIAYSLVMPSNTPGRDAVRGEDWLLHGTSRADVAKKYVSQDKAGQHNQASKPTPRDSLLRADGSPFWANIPAGGTLEKISSASGCAQVEPRELCEGLILQCRSRGVQFSLSTLPVGLAHDDQGAIVGVRVQNVGDAQQHATIPCKDVVISAGCWTPRVFEALTRRRMTPSIRPLPGYSLVVRSPRFARPIVEADENGALVEMAHAVFCPPTRRWSCSPECMARFTREGKPEIYVAGLNDETIQLPKLAGHSKMLMKQEKLDDLKKVAVALTWNLAVQSGSIASERDDLELVREGLCFRPVSESGLPIICKVKGFDTLARGSLYVASGHGPWGVTLSLATGFVVSELLQGLEPSIVLDPFGLVETSSSHSRARL